MVKNMFYFLSQIFRRAVTSSSPVRKKYEQALLIEVGPKNGARSVKTEMFRLAYLKKTSLHININVKKPKYTLNQPGSKITKFLLGIKPENRLIFY
jgi:hypothetical protein